MQYHIDGELVPADDASIPVMDRGFRYGAGAVERLRVYEGTVFQWGAHADRLLETCTDLGIEPGCRPSELLDRIEATLAANDLTDAVVELSITREQEGLGVRFDDTAEPTVVIVAEPAPPIDAVTEAVTLQTVRTRQFPPACLPGGELTLNRLTVTMASQELESMAADAPAEEALLRDLDGHVVGGARSAIGFVTESGFHTPANAGRRPPDITMAVVTDLAQAEDIPIHRGEYDRGDIQDATELCVVNTEWGVRPVDVVDGIDVGGGPVTKLLRRRFMNRVTDQCR